MGQAGINTINLYETSAAYIVAASDSTPADQLLASFHCDGNLDNVEIQAALNAAGSGGIVTLLPGHYSLGAALTIPDGVKCLGTARDTTVLTFTMPGLLSYHRGSQRASPLESEWWYVRRYQPVCIMWARSA